MIIGLGYKRRQGKDAVADVLVRRFGFHKMSYSIDGGLHGACMALNPIVGVATMWKDGFIRYADAVGLYGYEGAKDRYPEVVRTLQRMATEVGREHLGEYLGTPDIWVDIAMRAARGHSDVVFTNVRFWNEASKIMLDGGVVWEVVRPGLDIGDTSDVAQHSSETTGNGVRWDLTIVNDGTLEDLEDKVVHLMKKKLRREPV